MFFEPQLMGKEPMLRIPEGSSSKDLSLGQFRDTLWAQAKNLDPWELLPQFFLELIKETQPSRVGIFIPKIEWAEAKNLIPLTEEHFATDQILGPRIENNEITFHPFTSEQVVPAPYNTQHLETSSKAQEVELLLMPALACDRKGARLGRGKGFYDRYLSTRPKLRRCAVIHSSFLFDELPKGFFHDGDQRVHYVLTEKEFIKITNGNEVPL